MPSFPPLRLLGLSLVLVASLPLAFGGRGGGLAFPRGHQLLLNLGALGRIHGGLIAVRRQRVYRQKGAGFIGSRIRRGAADRHLADRRRTAAQSQRHEQQRCSGQSPVSLYPRHIQSVNLSGRGAPTQYCQTRPVATGSHHERQKRALAPKPLSPEIIKARTRKRLSGASIRPSQDKYRGATATFCEQMPVFGRRSPR